jgi:hypothetical protein
MADNTMHPQDGNITFDPAEPGRPPANPGVNFILRKYNALNFRIQEINHRLKFFRHDGPGRRHKITDHPRVISERRIRIGRRLELTIMGIAMGPGISRGPVIPAITERLLGRFSFAFFSTDDNRIRLTFMVPFHSLK